MLVVELKLKGEMVELLILQLSLCYCILNRFLVHIETDDIQDLVTFLELEQIFNYLQYSCWVIMDE